MVGRRFQVRHKDADFYIDYDTDNGLEIFGAENVQVISEDSDLLTITEKLKLVSIDEEAEKGRRETRTMLRRCVMALRQ
ncbi:hypothetical protein SAY86_030574 [Trapa natans]|uniref:Uncharacterized protein n=1 Tax=Trapa natans TaxID=22666 RepID=A0AAN7MSF2_TRANT|nr:hypothetical protein SAY86_030574 [Trapa natans]